MMVVKIIALVVPLGLDTFAVSLALGMGRATARQRMRTSLLFTAFEAAMPLLGIAIGRELGHAIGAGAVYAAIAVLFALAIYSFVAESDGERTSLLGRGMLASVLLGLSISLDELTIGIAFGLLRVPLVPVIALITVQAFILSQVGMGAGQGIGERVRVAAEHLAGIALVVLAIGLIVVQVAG
jgi:putative Mn2+ efflux pump MntP